MKSTSGSTFSAEELLAQCPVFGPQNNHVRPEAPVVLHFYSPKTGWQWYVMSAEMNEGELNFFGYVKGAEAEYGEFSLSLLEEFEAVLQSSFTPTRLDQIDWSLNEESNRMKREQYPELVPAGADGENLVTTKISTDKRFSLCYRVLLNHVGIGFVVQQNGRWMACESNKSRPTIDLRGHYAEDKERAIQSLVSRRLAFLSRITMRSVEGGHVYQLTIGG